MPKITKNKMNTNNQDNNILILPFNSIDDQEAKAALRVIEQGKLSGFYGSSRPEFFGGQEILALEKLWEKKFAIDHAISVNSATSGLIAAMGAIGILPGDEVIVPPYTMSATAIAPMIWGGIPVFVDIEPDYFCLDVNQVIKAITPKTKAIIVVNLFGHPAELAKLKKIAKDNNIYLIEDNAQAILATENNQYAGTIGDIGIFSLNIHKHIQTGEGGICVTNDKELALRLQLIRNHGENVTEWLNVSNLTNILGYNFRMSEIHAAIAIEQLKKVDYLVERCQIIAEKLNACFKSLDNIITPKVRTNCTHSYFMYSCHYKQNTSNLNREQFCTALNKAGLPISFGYVKPIYNLPVFKKFKSKCPITENCHNNSLIQLQPVSWDFTDQIIAKISDISHTILESSSQQLEQVNAGE